MVLSSACFSPDRDVIKSNEGEEDNRSENMTSVRKKEVTADRGLGMRVEEFFSAENISPVVVDDGLDGH